MFRNLLTEIIPPSRSMSSQVSPKVSEDPGMKLLGDQWVLERVVFDVPIGDLIALLGRKTGSGGSRDTRGH